MKFIVTSLYSHKAEVVLKQARQRSIENIEYEPLIGFNTLDFEYLFIILESNDQRAIDLFKRIKSIDIKKKIIFIFDEPDEIERVSFDERVAYDIRVFDFFELSNCKNFFNSFDYVGNTVKDHVIDDNISDEALTKIIDDIDRDQNNLALKNIDDFLKENYPYKKPLLDHFIHDFQLAKFDPETIADVKAKAEKIYTSLKKDKTVSLFLKNIYKTYPETLNHSFLTSVFSALIVEELEWAEERTADLVIKGSLLHNVGYLNLPEDVDISDLDSLSTEQIYEFEGYPVHGYNMLNGTDVGLQVKQIIYQHKEYLDGTGFPNQLSGMKIFPLAKIVSLACDFARIVIDNHFSPSQGLKEMIGKREVVSKYDANCMKALIKGMIR